MELALRTARGVPATLPVIAARGIAKSYAGVPALSGASLELQAGTVHALVGANGAGKSTFVKILAGLVHPDAGEIQIDGDVVSIDSPSVSTSLGLSFIHQELNLVPGFTVLQNMAMGYSLPTTAGLVRWSSVRRRATEVLDRFGARLPMDTDVSQLSVSDRWMVSLGRSLMRDARVIAMDEPTASFTAAEAEKLYEVIHALTGSGVAVLYISHRLDEVLALSDEITVFRNGSVVGRHEKGDVNRAELTESIVGREVLAMHTFRRPSAAPEDVSVPVLALHDLKVGSRVAGASLEIRQGEILGLAGLVGSGRTELARAIAGADGISGGNMELDGHPYSPRSPRHSIQQGVVLVPEERRSEALFLEESIDFNINLATLDENRLVPWLPILSASRARDAANTYTQDLSIKSSSTRQNVAHLSGGNQQKVILARFLRTRPRLLILDEPTVGVDVGARAEIYELVRVLTQNGTSVLMISSDFEELEICDRVAVMREGRIVTVVDGEKATVDTLTTLCYSPEE
ncbi:ribose import ATP-binding protein RbsA [Arthrobacter sp. StoSoilA2]|uniref:sugar ABC transporter ATP-binding protein n=1 Tax=Arthrobacter sp. StoSoilA2 TaxID=2830990 RepID=UPI001CC7ADD3|nr:sugar ABC transporter ATP-binding protein [Arthrobacter sp. StoSoilA2]BCW35866.1 ribose import ATP-binding protein RbsA [Arthrobacter sp. StoSoilA2]